MSLQHLKLITDLLVRTIEVHESRFGEIQLPLAGLAETGNVPPSEPKK